MLRALRLVVTVLGLAACVLVVAVWKRSAGLHEAVYGAVSSAHALAVGSHHGGLRFYTIPMKRLSGLPSYGTAQTCDMCCSSRLRTAVLYNDATRGLELAMPHWLAAILFGTTAAAPWLRFRFSLRTMLIATTLLAILLGFMKASN